MIVVYAIDALEYNKVEEYGCANLKQKFYGKTNISEFSQPRTIVLWSSFMTGENREKEILAKGDKEMWNTQTPIEKTLFSRFKKPLVIDLPGYNYDLKVHEKSRELLKAFFDTQNPEEKERIKKAYNDGAFEHHKKVKAEFLKALEGGHDFVLGYFSVADVVGHLNFGNRVLMKMIYKELDEIAGIIAKKSCKTLILSDHGMEAIGVFGDHSSYGFWSTNFKELKNPRITDLGSVLA